MDKKIVHYDATEFVQILIGFGAYVKPLDHTSDLVSNKQYVLTSNVIDSDDNGCFETENSLYVPVYK